MRLFDLRASGPTAGDCTTPYDVVFRNECTVREFIDEVLKQGEWGYVRIGSHFDSPQIEYSHNNIVSGVFCLDILNARINKATASGGWTRMDYMLDIQPVEQMLRNEYTRTLKEIVRHESEIEKLKKIARDLEGQLEAIDSAKTEKPQLDKDGCLYWDHVIKKEE